VAKQRADIYGDLDKPIKENPLIPAATVLLLRETEADGFEVLMLQKNKDISFGGMWVFPGGRIDPEDYATNDTAVEDAAIIAAVRETEEETGISLAQEGFVSFSHWSPPPTTPKRFATWFFIAKVSAEEAVQVDGMEITKHKWIKPAEALELQAQGRIDLAPPTWISLYHINLYKTVDAVLSTLVEREDKIYQTRIVKNAEGTRVALWTGDAGYIDSDVSASGDRHRLVLGEDGFVFENTIENY